MIGYLTANGKSSRDFNVYLTDAGVYSVAERDITTVTIPGRNGDLLIDNHRFKNTTHNYPCIIKGDFPVSFLAFIGYLLSFGGYIRIEDSFIPDIYVMAKYTGQTDPKKVYRDDMGKFELKFSRKPQRFLTSGEIPVILTSDSTLFNDFMPAKPMLRVYGTGEVGIGEDVITITAADEYTDIDCESENAFKGSTNCNGNIVLNTGRFFTLDHGESGITLGSGISRVEIMPRWWML